MPGACEPVLREEALGARVPGARWPALKAAPGAELRAPGAIGRRAPGEQVASLAAKVSDCGLRRLQLFPVLLRLSLMGRS